MSSAKSITLCDATLVVLHLHDSCVTVEPNDSCIACVLGALRRFLGLVLHAAHASVIVIDAIMLSIKPCDVGVRNWCIRNTALFSCWGFCWIVGSCSFFVFMRLVVLDCCRIL